MRIDRGEVGSWRQSTVYPIGASVPSPPTTADDVITRDAHLGL